MVTIQPPQLNSLSALPFAYISHITTMRPPARTTRSNIGPGLVDLPHPRRPSAVVAKEKSKKQKAATLKAEESRRRAAQVEEVEREIRRAQEETQPARRGGRGKIAKKTFPRPDGDANVSPSDLGAFTSPPVSCRLSHLPLPTQANRGKRNANSADLSDPEPITAKKSTKCVPQAGSLSDCRALSTEHLL